ncbi:MAG: DUF4397 domain-containing protein [Gammaproteobacteria bacterium]|nr:DUF4397 domain-containing protein [Gammaproteobacteria bacterium]
MKRLLLLVGLVITIVGCTGDSAFPTPTGKGTVRAIHAIKGAPDIAFLIEETGLDAMSYKTSSVSRRWDDFEYRFNFEVGFLGEIELRRVASRLLKVDANRDYTFVLTGAVTSPTITIWETDERIFDGTEMNFEARFAHTAPSLGAVDVYFADPSTPPAVGEERGTLNFGELLNPIDFEAGDYVLTMTTAGDPADVIFQSDTAAYAAQNALIIPIFDGDETDVAPYVVRLLNGISGLTALPDVRFSPTIRFFQASIDLPPSDVYDDEMLTNQVLANHMYGDISGDFSVPLGSIAYAYTAVGNTSAVQFTGNFAPIVGNHSNFVVVGNEGSRATISYIPDRRSISTLAKVDFFHASTNHELLDLYVVDAGESIAEVNPTLSLSFSLVSPNVTLEAGSYDIYLTTLDEKTVVSGPLRHDVVLGDSTEFIILDEVDPATAEIKAIPTL